MNPSGTTLDTVVDAMLTVPKTWPASTTIAEARAAFVDDHVHMLLLTSGGVLLGTMVRGDLAGAVPPATPALDLAVTSGRTARPDDDLEAIRLRMVATGQRRLAVIDPDDRLLGLLCLKRDGTGFCSDDGVAARAAEGAWFRNQGPERPK